MAESIESVAVALDGTYGEHQIERCVPRLDNEIASRVNVLMRVGPVLLRATATAFSALMVSDTPPTSAQEPPTRRFGISIVANAPDLLGGVGAYALLPTLGGLGIYLDAKFDLDSPTRDELFIESVTAQEIENEVAGAQFMTDHDSWRSFNAALLRPLTPAFMIYAGAGLAKRKRYRQYQDPGRELSELGFVMVEAPQEEWTTVNALAGAFIRMSRWLDFQFGLETAPRGFTVGASFKLPPEG